MEDKTKVLVEKSGLYDLRSSILECADKIDAAITKIDRDTDELSNVWTTETGGDEQYLWNHLVPGIEQARKDCAKLRAFAESLKSAISEYTDMDLDVKQKVIIMKSRVVETSVSKRT